MFQQERKCGDCGKTYVEPLLVCPECFDRVLSTDDPRLKRPWVEAARVRRPGESIESYASRVAEILVHLGPGRAPGIWREGVDYGHAGYIGGNMCTGYHKTAEEAERVIRRYRQDVAAVICAVLRSRPGEEGSPDE